MRPTSTSEYRYLQNADFENISQNKIKGYNSDLYTLAKYYIRRSTFVDRLIKIISEKKQSLIVTTAMLKIENSFTDAKDLNKSSGTAGSYAYGNV